MLQAAPLSVFLSYSHRDEPRRDRLEKHLALLKREGRITLWHDREIRGGEGWAERISDHLETADLVLLLVSADFLASDYCYETEMTRALERHNGGEARAVPIVLKPCDWQSAPFGRLQALPRDDRPVASWDDEEAAWAVVAKELRTVIEELLESRRGEPPGEPKPVYPNERIRGWSRQLGSAYRRLEAETLAGADVAPIKDEIRDLKRRLRDGGLQAGDLLAKGRFQLVAEIGEGAFATVWKAWDRRRRTLVAVKVLHTHYARDASRRRRFFRGAAEMARLRHPGVVRVIEEQRRDGRFHFFVMQLLDDGDLYSAILAGRFPDLGERLRLIGEVGEALAFAHVAGVVHRDVKPHNVLIDARGYARLTDFDLVRTADTIDRTKTGSMLGTWGYAAPEVIFDAKEATIAADIYGLGMTAVFALYGADLPPKVVLDAPGFTRQLDASAAVRRVLAKAVAFEPKDRYATVEELCEALHKEVAEPAPLFKPPSRLSKLREPRAVPPPPVGEELFRWIETPLDGRVELWRDVPAGVFQMGSPKCERNRDEKPRHSVIIKSPFRISAVPLTNAQFAAFEPKFQPHDWKGVSKEELAFHPVVDVSWNQAMEFCAWMAECFAWAQGARLPTEEEWEYACRAGTSTRYWKGDEEKHLDEVGWYTENSVGRTHRVGGKEANRWGLYDVHGNVWEWTLSPWTSDYSGRARGIEHNPAAVNPTELGASGAMRVIRGGGFWVTASRARSAYRDSWEPAIEDQDLGFRVLIPALPPPLTP